jgi:hypothetical protein
MSWINTTPPSGTLSAENIAALGAPAAAQQKLAEYLAAWNALASLAAKQYCITWQDKGTVSNDVAKAMQSLGMSVLVMWRGGAKQSAFKNAVLMRPARFEISILELPKLNRGASGTGLSAGRVACEILKALEGMPLAQGQISITDVSSRDTESDGQQMVVSLESALLVADEE